MKKIALVTVHYKGIEFTQKCLDSIRELKTPNIRLEVVVINNNPQENLETLKKKFADFLFLKTEKNLGYAGGYNLGIKKALEKKADFVFLVNNDTILAPDILVQLIKMAEKRKKAGLFSPKIYFAPGCEFYRDRYQKSERGKVIWFAGGKIDWQNVITTHRGVDEVDKGQFNQIEETDYVSGCGMFIKRKVIEKIGLLDEKYFLYFEDTDFSVRAKKAGFQLLFIPQAKMWHFNAGSSRVGGPLQDYYLVRNTLFFGFHYASLRTKFALFRWGLSRLFIGRPWQKKAFFDFLINRFGKGSYEA